MSRGVLYLHWGDLTELLDRSIASLKKWHPDLPYHVHTLPGDSSLISKTRMCELSPFKTTAYLDCDTVVLGKLDHAFDRAEKHGLACCINEAPWLRRYKCHSGDGTEYNTGVLFFDKSAFKATAGVWQRLASDLDSKIHFNTPDGPAQQGVNDQASFALALNETGFNPHILPLNWNFRPTWHRSFVGPIKIWHDYEDPYPWLAKRNAEEADAKVMDVVYLDEVPPPPEPGTKDLKIACAMSVPRLGFMENFFCWVQGLMPFGIMPVKYSGVFWGQCLERVMETQLHADYILTVDYDTVFREQDVRALLETAVAYPDADAIVPIQPRRGTGQPLLTIADDNGNAVKSVPAEAWQQPILPITTGHFGLTLLKTATLKKTPHPWFKHVPDDEQKWGEGRIDEDMYFWRQWHLAGNKVYLANRVGIGHMETVVTWTKMGNGKFECVYQLLDDYNKNGKPEGVW